MTNKKKILTNLCRSRKHDSLALCLQPPGKEEAGFQFPAQADVLSDLPHVLRAATWCLQSTELIGACVISQMAEESNIEQNIEVNFT